MNYKNVIYPPLWIGLWRTAVAAVIVLAIVLVIGLGGAFGYVRAGIAVVSFLAVSVYGVRWIRSAVTSLPEPDVADVSEYGLKYVCTMCGLELRLEVAARDKAPTHCMEPMVLVRSEGKPPLRSVD